MKVDWKELLLMVVVISGGLWIEVYAYYVMTSEMLSPWIPPVIAFFLGGLWPQRVFFKEEE